MSELEGAGESEVLQIPEGLSAIYLPKFSGTDVYGDLKPLLPEELLAHANDYLKMLNQAGVEIKAVIPVQVNMGKRPGVAGPVTETRQLLILKK